MRSLIANKIFKKNSLLFALSMCHCSNLIQQQFICSLYFFKLLFSKALKIVWQIFTTAIFKPLLFSSRATRFHTRLIEFLLLVACFVLSFYVRKRSRVMKMLEVERQALRLLENSIATRLLFVYCVHSVCGCVRILVYLFFSHA